jgi:glycosyltransferase involved in cell wall biosynthesis
MRPFGFNVVGHVSANVGLGVVARNAIRLIISRGHPVATLDIDPGRGRTGHETEYSELAVRAFDELPYGVTLVILSITALPDVLVDGRIVLKDDVINAGYFWWELPALTDLWIRSLEAFDVLVAGSQFIHSTFERSVSGTPSVRAFHAVEDVSGAEPNRAKFGIPSDKAVFVCIVEPTSDVVRKNPYAAIEAFTRAFDDGRDSAHLVVKVNNAQAARGEAALAPLREAVARLGPRVTLIDAFLSRREIIDLYASCDVFVGLHRAEGLGLGLMEAMSLGKPVLATGWSGNMSFMDNANACLVGYRLVPASGSLAPYSRAFLKQDVRWADPDLEAAAAWMRALAKDPVLRERIGHRGAEDINRYRAEAERAGFIDELHALWEHAAILPVRNRVRSGQTLAKLRQAQFEQQATPMQIVRRRSWRLLDRHLLWRFRSR